MTRVVDELWSDMLVVDEHTTVEQLRDQLFASGGPQTLIVVRLQGQRYAVLSLAELIDSLRRWAGPVLTPATLQTALSAVPDLLPPRVVPAVEQPRLADPHDTGQAGDGAARYLVVLAEAGVAGLLARAPVEPASDPEWLFRGRAARRAESFGVEAAAAAPADEAAAPADEAAAPPRWVHAEIKGHDPAQPLELEQAYTLAFSIEEQLKPHALLQNEAFEHRFAPGEQEVRLTIQLLSDDFEIRTRKPQPLRVPRTGRSRGAARFKIVPRHAGAGRIDAVFLKAGNVVQLISLTLQVGAAAPGGGLVAEARGRTLEAALLAQPRDLSLLIQQTGTGFRLTLLGAVQAEASLPLTLQELDQLIVEARAELLQIVQLHAGPELGLVYQNGIDIPPAINEQALQRLARAGFRLYQRIFFSPAADAQTNLLGTRLRELARRERLKLQIASQHFLLPWGMLYMAERFDPNAIDPECFLGLRHIIEQIPLQQHISVPDGNISSQPQLSVGLNLNTNLDAQVRHPVVAEQLRFWEERRQQGGIQLQIRETADQVLQALTDDSTADQILYFNCHAVTRALTEGGTSGTVLEFSGGSHLNLDDLSMQAPISLRLAGMPLVLLNACESAELSPLFYNGFVPYFMARGARGVIGTECKVPALFAAAWARRFFERFLPGAPLGELMLELRREFFFQHHNLLGLLYALYCDGDTQIVPGLQMQPGAGG